MLKRTFRLPDRRGRFGQFGGRFVPDTLVHNLEKLESRYAALRRSRAFWNEFNSLLSEFSCRPTPLYFAKNLSKETGHRVYLKREDLNHTGSHKLNNCVGQALVTRALGKRRVIAETGAGQHGVATATVCALFGFDCLVYMGAVDYERQKLNVFRMNLLGAKVVPVTSGSQTLKDAINEALRDWISNPVDTHYLLGSVVGPHPFPMMVRDFQSIIGKETKRQILRAERRLPDVIFSCVGGGSNSIGIFHPFIEDANVKLIGVEAAGHGLSSGEHSATLSAGKPGVIHGTHTYVLQDSNGQISPAHSVAAGLDYPAVGPEHSWLKNSGRAHYAAATDDEALRAFEKLSRTEGIIPALEPSHAIAYFLKIHKRLRRNSLIVINLSGRGDKDVQMVSEIKK